MKDFKCNKCGFSGHQSELILRRKAKRNKDSEWEYFPEEEFWDMCKKVRFFDSEYTRVCPECKTDNRLEFPTKIELAVDGEVKVYRIFEKRAVGPCNNYRYTLDKDALTKDNPEIFRVRDLLSYHSNLTDEGNLQMAIDAGIISRTDSDYKVVTVDQIKI